ncbi:MAG: zinc ribbon domain-containing protein [Clostridia bacterium]|nr:zinc ribbon domain-containing protein [Clostridia bacterium]MBR0415516.1 zinc ribbon domain-containing protein [Clostridia bacterium]
MVCPNCNKIIAEGSAACPFCKAQLTAAPASVQGAAAPGAAQMPYAPQPYVPQPLTPQQKYQNLGGFLQFVVALWKYILPILVALELLIITVASVLRIIKLDSITWESLKPILSSEVTILLLAAKAVLYCVVAIKIEKRQASFLAFWQTSMIVLSVLSLASILVFSGVLRAAFGLGGNVLMFFIWNLYFTKSLRVRIYMGSDAYLRASIFNKKTPAPAPERPKSEKTKVILLAVALLLVYYVLAGFNVYLTAKENAPALKATLEARGQETTYTDETAGVSFTIPKGFEENKDLETEEIPLALECPHSNFEVVEYASFDLLKDVSEEEKQHINRKEINNAAFTRQEIQEQVVEDFAAASGVSDLKTTVERIGGYEYYVVSLKQTDQAGNSAECINYVHYYNGYQLLFHYESGFTQVSLDSVKEMISTVTIEGEAPLPAQK